MFDVCCLGILVADITVKPVDRLPEPGGLSIIDPIRLGLGGCAANTAVCLKKIGISSTVIGSTGRDSFGTYIVDTLKANGIGAEGVAVLEGTPTSAAIVLVGGKGERSFLHNPGTNGIFSDRDVNFDIIKNSKILLISGALLMPTLDGIQTAQILKHARKHGIYTALDTARDATGRWLESIGPCLEHLDLFIPSIDEAEMLSNKKDPVDMADFFLARGVKLCVIKLGKQGCYIKSANGKSFTIPSYDRIAAKDTTGAGDSFVAGFLTGILKGWEPPQCGRFANAVGTHCVSQMGTTAGICSLERTLEFMREYENGRDII